MRPAPVVHARAAFVVGVALLLLGCRDDAVSPRLNGPTYAVSDGAHEDGNPDFFFLPPLFTNPSSHPNYDADAFNPNLRPAVEICKLGPLADDGTRECAENEDPLIRFAPSMVMVSAEDEHYHVNWHTDQTPELDVESFYRIRVLLETEQLGFADIDPVLSGRDLRSVETGEYIGLVDGRTLPIKFRIENGASLCGTPESPCAAGTINLETGGRITLPTETETFKLDIPVNTEATFGGQPVTDITFSLETCPDLELDLPLFGDCLRVTTFFTVEGTSGSELVLTNNAQLWMCVLEPGLDEFQEDLITLHQKDGDLIRALPHVEPFCETATTLPGGWRGLATQGWRWMRSLAARAVAPKMLFAGSRSVAFNLGGGGETDRFGSSCDGGGGGAASAPGPMLVSCPPSSAPALSATATRTETRTSSDFQFALPAKMDYVVPADADRTSAPGELLTAVRVTDWDNAAVVGAVVTFIVPGIEGPGTVLGSIATNSDGIAEISWTIVEGTNTLIASGRGIAGPNNYPEAEVRPFMPDIEDPHPSDPACIEGVQCQDAVALGTGRLEFSATGEVPFGSLQFEQQPTTTVSGDAIAPALRILLFDPSGAPVPEFVRVTVGNDPANPETCQVLQVSTTAIEGVAVLDNVIVNGICTGARVAVTAGGIVDYDFPIIFSEPFDIVPAAPEGIGLETSFETTNVPLEGSVAYVAAVTNGTLETLTGVVVQAFIDQGDASRAAGGAQMNNCGGAGLGVLPPGVCSINRNLVASNEGAGTGTLVPGPATARINVEQGATILATVSLEITIVAP